jgi:hypothetical protein
LRQPQHTDDDKDCDQFRGRCGNGAYWRVWNEDAERDSPGPLLDIAAVGYGEKGGATLRLIEGPPPPWRGLAHWASTGHGWQNDRRRLGQVHDIAASIKSVLGPQTEPGSGNSGGSNWRGKRESIADVCNARRSRRAYDSDPLHEELRRDGIEMIAPHRANGSKPPTQDRRRLSRYMRRWLVERRRAGRIRGSSVVILFRRFRDRF